MSITIDAVYEDGILKLAQPLSGLKERAKVRLTIEPADDSLQLPHTSLAGILERMDHRRVAIYKRCGELEDSTELIREGRERELE